jgi:hypothetical protein
MVPVDLAQNLFSTNFFVHVILFSIKKLAKLKSKVDKKISRK